MTYKFGLKSVSKLMGVHADLQRVMYEAIINSPHDFSITEGLRSPERQAELFKAGKSRTMNSRHLTGHAVDIAVIKEGDVVWELGYYKDVAAHIQEVSGSLLIPIVWGGSWKTLVDGPHFELDRNVYP